MPSFHSRWHFLLYMLPVYARNYQTAENKWTHIWRGPDLWAQTRRSVWWQRVHQPYPHFPTGTWLRVTSHVRFRRKERGQGGERIGHVTLPVRVLGVKLGKKTTSKLWSNLLNLEAVFFSGWVLCAWVKRVRRMIKKVRHRLGIPLNALNYT